MMTDATASKHYGDSYGSQMRILMHLYVGDRIDDVKKSHFDHSGDDRGMAEFNANMKVLKFNGYVNRSGSKITEKGEQMAEIYIKTRANRARFESGSQNYIQVMA